MAGRQGLGSSPEGAPRCRVRLQGCGDFREIPSRRKREPRSERSWDSQLAGPALRGGQMAQEGDFRNGLIFIWAPKAPGSVQRIKELLGFALMAGRSGVSIYR